MLRPTQPSARTLPPTTEANSGKWPTTDNAFIDGAEAKRGEGANTSVLPPSPPSSPPSSPRPQQEGVPAPPPHRPTFAPPHRPTAAAQSAVAMAQIGVALWEREGEALAGAELMANTMQQVACPFGWGCRAACLGRSAASLQIATAFCSS